MSLKEKQRKALKDVFVLFQAGFRRSLTTTRSAGGALRLQLWLVDVNRDRQMVRPVTIKYFFKRMPFSKLFPKTFYKTFGWTRRATHSSSVWWMFQANQYSVSIPYQDTLLSFFFAMLHSNSNIITFALWFGISGLTYLGNSFPGTVWHDCLIFKQK